MHYARGRVSLSASQQSFELVIRHSFMGEKVDANAKTEWGTELTWLLNLKKIEKILAIYV